MKNLVICQTCQNNGIRQILGEIDNQGHFLVLRFHNGFTRIVGGSFIIACGKCNTQVYFKKGESQEYGTISQSAYGFIGMNMLLSNHGTNTETMGSIEVGTA